MWVQIPPFTPINIIKVINMCELSREDQLRIMFRGLEHKRKIGNVYTLEEIELYTKENPDKVFLGDIVSSKDDDYLVYNGEKWMYIDDHLNSKIECEVISHKTIKNPHI